MRKREREREREREKERKIQNKQRTGTPRHGDRETVKERSRDSSKGRGERKIQRETI